MKNAPIVATQRPYQWRPVRAYNAIARITRLRKSIGSSADLLATARSETGSSAPIDDLHVAGLEQLLSALATEADLTPAGRWFARGAMVSALSNRLLIEQSLQTDPVILSRPVGPAVVIVGLPRSGTTLLQNLLALDPANRSLRQWEANRPAPPPLVDAEGHDDRVRQAERNVWLVDRIAPAARALHPTGPRLPTECVALFANSMASLEYGVIYQVPSYVRWTLATDMRPHYAYYAKQLQLLARHDHRERWTLKSPAHLFWMDELLGVLPDANIVQLHRDPLEVLGSFCSLVAVSAGTSARRIDFAAIGALWPKLWADGLTRAAAARARAPQDRWLDLRYERLVADPVAAIGALYEAFGFSFTDRFAAAMRTHVERNPQHHRGVHAYQLTDFGIDAERERERFATIRGVPRKQPSVIP